MASTVKAILGILLALGILILLLSSSLIANTLNALMNQHLRYIGIMKLVGARRNQILQMYFVLIFAVLCHCPADCRPFGRSGCLCAFRFYCQKDQFCPPGLSDCPACAVHSDCGRGFGSIAGGAVSGVIGSRITVVRALSEDLIREEEKLLPTW